MELEVLPNKGGKIEEAVVVALSLAEVNLEACLESCINEVFYEELPFLGEFIISSEINKNRGLGSLIFLYNECWVKILAALDGSEEFLESILAPGTLTWV